MVIRLHTARLARGRGQCLLRVALERDPFSDVRRGTFVVKMAILSILAWPFTKASVVRRAPPQLALTRN